MSIRKKLTLVLLTAIIVPMLVVGVASFVVTEERLEMFQVAKVESIADLKAQKIQAFIEERINNVEDIRNCPVVRNNLPLLISHYGDPSSPEFKTAKKELDAKLKPLQKIYPFDDIVLTDPEGRMLYLSNEEHEKAGFGRKLPVAELHGLPTSYKGFRTSGIFRNEREGGKHAMFIVAPVVGAGGNEVGSVAMEIDLSFVYDLVSGNTNLGATGETVLGMRAGRNSFTHLSISKNEDRAIPFSEGRLVPMQEAVMGQNGAGYAQTSEGGLIVAAWRHIPALDLGLVTKISAEEAFAPVQRLRTLGVSILALAALIGALAALRISRSITEPIFALKRGAEVIGSGDLDHRVGLEGNDEIGELSKAIDDMTERLKRVTASRDRLDREVSERRRAEDRLRRSRQNLQVILDSMPFGVVVIGADMRVRHANNAALAMTGYGSGDELCGSKCTETFCPDSGECPVIDMKEDMDRAEHILVAKDGRRIPVMKSAIPINIDDEDVILEAFVDITEMKKAGEKVRAQLEQLRALRTIDMAITGSFNRDIIFKVFLNEALSQLKADAVGMLLLRKHSFALEHAAGKGFVTEAYRGLSVSLGDSLAGRVAVERRPLLLPDISVAGISPGWAQGKLVAAEGFKSYFGFPLVVKGEVRGVLEAYHRSNFAPHGQWLDFFEALAGQAAIALDNASLFEDLQRSNEELVLAYDTTIEGWAKALDYRDKETEGHSRRVTELTVAMARKVGIKEEEILHVRRGALLHDIGKLGVPDAILLKQGKLTDDEWDQMKKHPKIAYDLISSIHYLRPAVDIPYCHHEKWDGSGYPRGLKGEQIPLAARIFALVDVWDALRSDRPYRPAWPEGKALEYINSEVGKHFDPKVVEVFLDLLRDMRAHANTSR